MSNPTKINPKGVKPESSSEQREREAKAYSASVANQKSCCTKPTDWKEAYSAGLGEASGPISRCTFRCEFGSKVFGFFAIIILGITFLLNWVILKRLRFTQGYPMPMHIDGGCMCGDVLCDDVLFTFDINIDDKAHNDSYHKKWLSTQYYDRDQTPINMIAPATSMKNDTLVTGISDPGDIEKLKKAQVDKYILFKATDVPHLLYTGLDQTKGHYVCSNTFRGEEEYGTNWKVTDDRLCERVVSLKLMKFDALSKPPSMKFAQTLAQLHFPAESNPEFVSPLCKQGPQLFLAAGLRGTITLVDVDQEQVTEGETFRTLTGNDEPITKCLITEGETFRQDAMPDFCAKPVAENHRRTNDLLLPALTQHNTKHEEDPALDLLKMENTEKKQKKFQVQPLKNEENAAIAEEEARTSVSSNSRRLINGRRRLGVPKNYVEINSGTCREYARLEAITTRQECQDAFNDDADGCRGWDGVNKWVVGSDSYPGSNFLQLKTDTEMNGGFKWKVGSDGNVDSYRKDLRVTRTCSTDNLRNNLLLADTHEGNQDGKYPAGCYTANKRIWNITLNRTKLTLPWSINPGAPVNLKSSDMWKYRENGDIGNSHNDNYATGGYSRDAGRVTMKLFNEDITASSELENLKHLIIESDDLNTTLFDSNTDIVIGTDANDNTPISAADITSATSSTVGRFFNTVDNYGGGTDYGMSCSSRYPCMCKVSSYESCDDFANDRSASTACNYKHPASFDDEIRGGVSEVLESNYQSIQCKESNVVGYYDGSSTGLVPRLGCSPEECCRAPTAADCTGQTPQWDSSTSSCRGWVSDDCSGGSTLIDAANGCDSKCAGVTCPNSQSCVLSDSGGYVCYDGVEATCSSTSFSNCDQGWTIKSDTSSFCSGSRRLSESIVAGTSVQPLKHVERKLINGRNLGIERRLSSDYTEIDSGSCAGLSGYEEIGSRSECSSAWDSCTSCSHSKSGLRPDDSENQYPPGCYHRTNKCTVGTCIGNYFNTKGTANCASNRRCLCKKSTTSSTTSSTSSTSSTSAQCTVNCKTCSTSDCCTANPCNSTHVENSDKSTADSIQGNTGDTVRVTCADGFLTKSQSQSALATCGADGTFSKVICCKHCVPPFDPFEWAITRNVQCTKGSSFSGCDCSDNSAGDAKTILGQTCIEKTSLTFGLTFGYNRINMTKDEDCKMTKVQYDVCAIDNNGGVTNGAVMPISWNDYSNNEKLGIAEHSSGSQNECRANKMQFSVLQLPAEGVGAIKSVSHDHCWLTETPMVATSSSDDGGYGGYGGYGGDSGDSGDSGSSSSFSGNGTRRSLWFHLYHHYTNGGSSTKRNLEEALDTSKYDETYQNAWGHKQKWHQMAEFDNSKMVWIGILLGILCGMMAYIDFLATFVPASHPLASRCDVPMILAKLITLMCCPCSKTYSWPMEKGVPVKDIEARANAARKKDLEEVRSWDSEEEKQEVPDVPMDDCRGRCGNREICSKRKSWIRSEDGGGFRDNLVYLLIQLPFNVMLSCYTVVGTNFVSATSGKVSGGLWALGSPVAIQMIEMPTIFTICIFSFIGGAGLLSLVKYRKVNEECLKLCAGLSTGLIFVAWLGISVWIFVINAQNVLSNTTLEFSDIVFGISPPFKVPDIQMPSAILTFSYGFIKLNLFLMGWIKKIVAFINKAKKAPDLLNETGLKAGKKKESVKIGGPVGPIALEAGKEKLKAKLKEKLIGAIDEALEKEIEALKVETASQADIDALEEKIKALPSPSKKQLFQEV